MLQSTVHPEASKDLLDTVATLSETESDSGPFRCTVIIELHSLGKVNSIASSSDMAFTGRGRRANALIEVFWDKNIAENEAKGAAKAKAITGVLNSFETDAYTSHAYGNYSTSSNSVFNSGETLVIS